MSAEQMQEAVVKPLEWTGPIVLKDGDRVWAAIAGGMEFTYSIWGGEEGRFFCAKLLQQNFDSLDEAKNAVQADYEARIRSALVAPAASSQERIAQLEAQAEAGWISVADKLPGEQGCDSENVLCFLNGHCDPLDMACRGGGGWGIRIGYYDAEKQCFRAGGIAREVTHWMPLPAAPERIVGAAK